MAEVTSNVEMAHEIAEHGHHSNRTLGALEILEAIILAVVAVATAWTGYQAALWDGQQARLYGESSKLRVTADELETLGGQERIYDTMTISFWLSAKAEGNEKLAALYEKRFRDEFRAAFNAWMALDPFNNPQAPPGPTFMPQYHDANADQAVKLNAQASAKFDQGTAARQQAERYVRVTLYLATVLLLTAISQRFRFRGVRIGMLGVSGALLGIALYSLLALPRL
jgi:hypothetical protein